MGSAALPEVKPAVLIRAAKPDFFRKSRLAIVEQELGWGMVVKGAEMIVRVLACTRFIGMQSDDISRSPVARLGELFVLRIK